jgi:predicted Zn finger-like uncharacterized protein
MKFECDSCHAQFMISDEKVGPNGVIVRCKKCKNKIVVKRPPQDGEQILESPAGDPSPLGGLGGDGEAVAAMQIGQAGTPENEAAIPPSEAAPTAETGTEDEIGRAFDSVLSAPDEPAATAGETPVDPVAGMAEQSLAVGRSSGLDGEGNFDREPPRALDLAAVAGLAEAEAKPEAGLDWKPPASSAPAGAEALAASSTAREWYVAVNDQQVGPLSIEGVHERWSQGELSADSLAWRAGMADWKPLSTIHELANHLAPVHKSQAVLKPEGAAGAIATGAEAAASSALPPQQEEPGEPVWKPSAASALESLVKDELEALAKPPPKPPEAEKLAQASKAPGLMDDLPEMAAAPAGTGKAHEPSEPGRPALTEQPGFQAPLEEPRKIRESVGQDFLNEHVPPAYGARAPKSNTGLYIVLSVLGGVVLLGGMISALFFLFLKQQPPAVAPAATPATQPVAQPAAIPAAVPGAPSPAATSPAAANPAAPAAAAAATTPAAGATPATAPGATPGAAPGTTPPAAPVLAPPAAAKSEVAAKNDSAGEEEPRGKAAKKVKAQKAEAARPAAAAARAEREESPAPPPKKSGNKVDDDFESLFGGPDKGSAEAPAPKKGKTVYVPPAVGAGSSDKPREVAQSDIMATVVSNKPAIKRCVDEQKSRDPGASGTLVMRWNIKPNGSVGNVQTVSPEFQKTPISNCMTATIKGWRFPEYAGPQMAPIEFPFKF